MRVRDFALRRKLLASDPPSRTGARSRSTRVSAHRKCVKRAEKYFSINSRALRPARSALARTPAPESLAGNASPPKPRSAFYLLPDFRYLPPSPAHHPVTSPQNPRLPCYNNHMPTPRKKLTGRAQIAALRKVKAVILDIDGVLTDGTIFYVEGTGWGARYSVIDGFGIKLLQRAGFEVCVISGGSFTSHKKRAESLGIKHAYFGDENKLHAFDTILRDLIVTADQCAYIGDELFDIPVLERVGFAATPPHAPAAVKAKVHYVTKKAGGFGAARELCDLILAAHTSGGAKTSRKKG